MKRTTTLVLITFCLGFFLFTGSHIPLQPSTTSAAETPKPATSSYISLLKDHLGAKGRLEFIGSLVRFTKDKNGTDTFMSLGDDLVAFDSGATGPKIYCHLSQLVFVVPKFQL